MRKKAVQQGLYVAIRIDIMMFISLMAGVNWFLSIMQLEAVVHNITKSYIYAMCAGILPLFFIFLYFVASSMRLVKQG